MAVAEISELAIARSRKRKEGDMKWGDEGRERGREAEGRKNENERLDTACQVEKGVAELREYALVP